MKTLTYKEAEKYITKLNLPLDSFYSFVNELLKIEEVETTLHFRNDYLKRIYKKLLTNK